MSPYLLLRKWLSRRLDRRPLGWLEEATHEIAEGASPARFAALFSVASRHVRDEPLAPSERELRDAARAVPGWSPERWTRRETARAAVLLARPDLAEESATVAVEELFRFADEGELRALCRSLALFPAPERFLARAREGCRSNMRSVFEATALDTPYPAHLFDEQAWNQAVIKCLFVEAPLWRMHGLDERLSPELARMALDLADERRSAGRTVRHELWLCLGPHGGARGLEALLRELDPANPHTLGRRGAAYGLVRAGEAGRLRTLLEGEEDPAVRRSAEDALAGDASRLAFRALDPDEPCASSTPTST